VVLGRWEEFGGLAVANGVQGNFRAFEKFLDDDAGAGGAETFLEEDFVDGAIGFFDRVADQNAFAEGEPVDFNRAAAFELAREIFGGSDVAERAGFGGGDAVFLHEVLGENFGGFELGGFFVCAPNAVAAGLEEIDDAEGEWVVWTDDGEVGFVLFDEVQEGGKVFGADWNVLDEGAVLEAFEGDAGVAGGAPELGGVRGLGEFPDEGVFAAAGTEDEDFHAYMRSPWRLILRVRFTHAARAERRALPTRHVS
jgi:hypothetical protein